MKVLGERIAVQRNNTMKKMSRTASRRNRPAGRCWMQLAAWGSGRSEKKDGTNIRPVRETGDSSFHDLSSFAFPFIPFILLPFPHSCNHKEAKKR